MYNQTINDYYYFQDIATPNINRLLCYNPNANRVFACGGTNLGKLNIIDGSNNLLVTSIDILYPNSLIYVPNNWIYCGGKNRLIKITGNSNTISSECTKNIGGTSYGLAIKNSTHKIWSANPEAGHLTIFDVNQPDPNIILENTIQTGGSTYFGCFNSTNNKYYFIQNDSYNEKSFVNIYNATTHDLINTLVLDGAKYLKTCAFNEQSNKIFITAQESNSIYVISGENDYQIEAVITNILAPKRIESIPNTNKLICGAESAIYFIDATNFNILETIGVSNVYVFMDFQLSELDPNYIYASCPIISNPSSSEILKINLNDYSFTSISLPDPFPGQMVCDGHSLYVLRYLPYEHPCSLWKINETTFSLVATVPVMPASYNITFSPFTNKVYILHRDSPNYNTLGGITIVDGNNNVTEIEIEGMHCPGMFFNPNNNRIYFHTIYNPSSTEKESYLTSFDCTNEVVESVVYLGQKQNFNESSTIYTALGEGMVFNPDNDQLIIGNRGFSNLSVVQCATDKLGLNYGWHWISFPRMERYAFADEPVSPVPIMKNASFYDDYYFTLWAQLQPNYIYKRFNPIPPDPWSGILSEVKSTKGYKYEIPQEGSSEPIQVLTGARLYPECAVELPATGEEKWIGYFIEGSQYPWDAFPSNIYEGPGELTQIQAQYWSMHKISNPGGGWGWVISGKVKPIKYGDMVIIKYQGEQNSFVWNNPEESEQDKDILKPQAYTVRRKPIMYLLYRDRFGKRY
ncbi:MAG: hypothetical protein R2764_22370 [Bacteroidales bacterium]